MDKDNNLLGYIYISHRAIASIAYYSALESYGVVGFAPKNIAKGIANVLVKDPALGIDVRYDGNSVSIDLYIIVEYGTRIKSVASIVSDNVRFQIEKNLVVPVESVNVHVRGLRISDPD
ncbi:MAG: Asp23/Gls24 family envelope stress response protein [Bacteroidales bacterium]|nr:Asp23/Gls24 family envelope stress response protein [Bacteroidales bacterium]